MEKNALLHDEAASYLKDWSNVSGSDIKSHFLKKNRTGSATRDSIHVPAMSEPEVVRHYTRLSRLNFTNDIGLYPLGSCTMKYNPSINEVVASMDGFADLHPLQGDKHSQGALEVMYLLQEWLADISGLPAVSLSPAAGAHGEWTALKVFEAARAYEGRNKAKFVAVPDSAHGTNPASVVMCGYSTISIPSSSSGEMDIDFLRSVVNDQTLAVMMTNPNTCGVFEKRMLEISQVLRAVGGYVYYDGANLNALVGKIRPGDMGADAMHFNLHKTFSTPHGGGGPGSGPVAVSEKLRKFLPKPVILKKKRGYVLDDSSNNINKRSIGRVKAFHGHFETVVRALTYLVSLGRDGITEVAEAAVLNANYLLSKLKEDYHAPYGSKCMHEFVLSDSIQSKIGGDAMSVAKGLIERGFHPMTVYFPLIVKGAMLVEPTESESKSNLDEFASAMKDIAICFRDNLEKLKEAPVNAPRRRIDETKAARKPIIRA